MTEKTITFERMNESFHLKCYSDNTVDIIDVEDKETITTKADKLPAINALVNDLRKFREKK